MPNLFELKSLENLKYVHRQYIRYINKHRNNRHKDCWKLFTCPICHHLVIEETIKIDNMQYHRCANCDCIYNSPQLVAPLDNLYDTYRDKLVKPSESLRKQLGLIKYQQVQAYFKFKGYMLDVGCGNMQLVGIFNEQEWHALGVDPCIGVRFEDYYPNMQFDCITFFGVLEHVNNPMQLLNKARGLLKPNGLIVIEVPSADCLLMQYLKDNPFSPYRFIEHCRHLSFWSRFAIDYVCGKLNLKVVDLKSVGFDLQTITLASDPLLIKTQAIVDNMLLGDHYRIFMKARD